MKGSRFHWLLGVVGLIVGLIMYLTIRKDSKARKETAEQKAAALGVKNTYASAGSAILNGCEHVADNIYSAFHDSITEDEGAAISNINKAKTQYQVKIVCAFYQAKYERSLKADFENYVHWPDTTTIDAVVKKNWF